MRVVWVYENIEKSSKFYSKLNILLLLSSVSLWRRNHKDDICTLYADDLTIDTLNTLKVIGFWDEIKPIPNPRKINKEVFWASSKLQVLAGIREPVILMDHDTHVYKPIKHLLTDSKVYVCNYELGKGYYPSTVDKYIQQLSYKPRWETDSVNVAFLYLPDYKFTNEYASLSLQIMEELSALKAPNPQYLIFSEQLLLFHLLEKYNIPNASIISTDWDCKEWDWGNNNKKGIWNYYESLVYFKHYGPDKGKILESRDGENYNAEINNLLNCINFPNLNIDLLPKK